MSKKTWNLLLRLACLLLIGGLLSGCMVGETSSRREITSAAPAASETAAPSQAEPAASSQTETIATVEPQTCFTYDGLTVTATGLENSLLGSPYTTWRSAARVSAPSGMETPPGSCPRQDAQCSTP